MQLTSRAGEGRFLDYFACFPCAALAIESLVWDPICPSAWSQWVAAASVSVQQLATVCGRRYPNTASYTEDNDPIAAQIATANKTAITRFSHQRFRYFSPM